MTNNSRWYDSDPRLKSLMHFLELASPSIKKDVTMDIMQIIIQEGFRTSDEIIEFFKDHKAGNYSRWYDKNEVTHSGIELLKILNEEEKQTILPEIVNGILYFNARLAS